MIHQKRTISFLLFYFIFSLSWVSDAKYANLYFHCSEFCFSPNTAYDCNLKLLFTALVKSAAIGNFNTFKIPPPGDNSLNDAVYGLFQCRGDLKYSDCRKCVANSIIQFKTACSFSIGGTIQVDGCFVKYDNTSFIGVENKTEEEAKSCGPSSGYNTNVLNERDETLANLIAQNGQFFRSCGSGSVQGVAQCIQDLTESDCQDCLADASGQLRSACETSSWGDMFLGKCYIRYGDKSKGLINDLGLGTENDGANKKNILKTVGIIAAALLLTGGLSFCISASMSKKNKTTNADGAKEVAQDAKKVAQDSKKTAQDAKEAAQDAKKVAQDSKKTAQDAKEAAQDSKKTAQDAKEAAQDAKKVAQDSKKTAQDAKEAAQDSKKTAQDAKEAAQDAKKVAQDSKKTAQDAKEAAQDAKKVAQDSKKTTQDAKEAAQDSKKVAQDAKSTADIACEIAKRMPHFCVCRHYGYVCTCV